MAGGKKCKVCEEAQSKYKCPACLIPYCSLPCFKKHKEIPCIKPNSSPDKEPEVPCIKPNSSPDKTLEIPCIKPNSSPDKRPSDGANLPKVDKPCYVEEPSEVMQQLQLEAIASSSEIRDALRNEELQKLICNIDCSQDAMSELEKAMEVDAFRIFTDKILSTISPQQ